MKSFSFNWGFLLVLWSEVFATNVQANVIQGRIISGSLAAIGQFPWQVILKQDEYDQLKCGGSIISNIWVLSAAHCVYGLPSILLVFGTIELENTVNNMTSSQLFVHPQYFPPDVNNDISLIKLPIPLSFCDTIQPIALPASSMATYNFVGVTATIAGFGLTDDEYLDPSQVLLFAQVKIIELNSCRAIYPNEQIDDTNLCAKGEGDSNMSTCSGDSGGPLIVATNGQAIQIGINSFVATDACTERYPSGYVKLTSYLNYISSVTGLNFD